MSSSAKASSIFPAYDTIENLHYSAEILCLLYRCLLCRESPNLYFVIARHPKLAAAELYRWLSSVAAFTLDSASNRAGKEASAPAVAPGAAAVIAVVSVAVADGPRGCCSYT